MQLCIIGLGDGRPWLLLLKNILYITSYCDTST